MTTTTRRCRTCRHPGEYIDDECMICRDERLEACGMIFDGEDVADDYDPYRDQQQQNAEDDKPPINRISRGSSKVRVECLECGRKFQTANMLPSCPKCGGSDIDLA